MFDTVDSNHSGMIVLSEIKGLSEKLGLNYNEQQFHAFMHNIDKNKDGKIGKKFFYILH